MLRCAVLCCALLCSTFGKLLCAVILPVCHAVLCCAALSMLYPWHAALCCDIAAVLCAVLRCAVLCCQLCTLGMLLCAVLYHAVLYHAVLCCAVLCCDYTVVCRVCTADSRVLPLQQLHHLCVDDRQWRVWLHFGPPCWRVHLVT